MVKRDPHTKEADFWGMARSYLHSYCPKVRQLSYETINAYRISLECLLDYLLEEAGICEGAVSFDIINRDRVKGWVCWMASTKHYQPKTISLRLTALRSFLSFCAAEDSTLMALYQQISTVKGPSIPKRPVEYLGGDELSALFGAYDGATSKSRRNRAMLIVLFESAARISEFSSITLGDVLLAKPARLVLTGKANKTRVVPIGDACREHLRVYIEEFHAGGLRADPSRPLFYSLHAGIPCALSADAISRVLKQAGDRARLSCPSIPKKLHCHLIRKSRAMALYEAGVPLPLIMQLLGHESMATTSSFYAFATVDMMTRAIAESAPAILSEDTGWLTDERKAALYSLR